MHWQINRPIRLVRNNNNNTHGKQHDKEGMFEDNLILRNDFPARLNNMQFN